MQVILLNQDYSYINSISVRRALRLIAKGKVTVEKYSERIVRTVTKDIAVPLILRSGLSGKADLPEGCHMVQKKRYGSG